MEIPHDAPPEILRSLARSLRAQAAALDRAAERRETTLNMRAENGRILAANKRAGEEAYKRVAAGQSAESAIADVATASGIRPDTVAAWLRHAKNAAHASERAARDREMLTLAARGWTNAEIGRRFKLHEKTVQRRISLARRCDR